MRVIKGFNKIIESLWNKLKPEVKHTMIRIYSLERRPFVCKWSDIISSSTWWNDITWIRSGHNEYGLGLDTNAIGKQMTKARMWHMHHIHRPYPPSRCCATQLSMPHNEWNKPISKMMISTPTSKTGSVPFMKSQKSIWKWFHC